MLTWSVAFLMGRCGLRSGQQQRPLLAFESAHPTPAKEELIRRQLAVTPARYYVLLLRAASSREGQAFDAITAHLVSRARD
ncbi:DUF3263 domain-containing protein [Microbacterium sp. SORGH_AS_0888]|uniref:DUF3263 domain-containing protein n=1 Tax=Microbacterium sp. SORGH_AS_0888 TaxID=3041791 RepID=UPI00358FB06A